MNNLKKRRGWTTPTTPTTATPRDVAAVKVTAVNRVSLGLAAGDVFVVAGSSVYHDHACSRIDAALASGKTLDRIKVDDVGKRMLCAECRKLGAAS